MSVNLRVERIERLLDELRYEIERGMMEGEVDEDMGFLFFVPNSKKIPGGCVRCEFRTRPLPGYQADYSKLPKLRVVK